MTKVLRGDHNQCPSCNHYFNSTKAFEKHRTGEHGVDRRCKTPTEMQDSKMSISRDGYWITKQMDKGVLQALL